MFRRLNRKSRANNATTAETTVYAPEPKYAVQADEEKRRSTSSQGGKVTTQQQPPLLQRPPSVAKADDETAMTLEEIKLKRKVSVSQSGKVHKKSSRNSVVDIFGDDDKNPATLQQWDKSEGTRQPRSTADLQL